MERKEELQQLQEELDQTPIELEFSVQRGIARAKKQGRASILWKAPLLSFGSVIILFILLVNLFPAVALAMSNIPVLKELVSVVSFDPSLKLAVENDYVQIIDNKQTQGDVAVTVEYLILDAGHISLFFRVDAPVNAGIYNYDFTDSGTQEFPAGIMFDTMYKSGTLEELKIDFVDGSNIPKIINFGLTINVDPNFQETRTVAVSAVGIPLASEPEAAGTDYEFKFKIRPDEEFSQIVEVIPLNQWLEINDQRILLETLEIYPTQARLYLDFDDSNSALVEALDLHFEDEKGNIYDIKKNGVTGTGNSDNFDIRSIHFESSYFNDAKQLLLYIDGISMIDKEQLFGEINYSNKAVTNMPQGIKLHSMLMKGTTLELILESHSDIPNNFQEVISSIYYDIDGNEYHFGSRYISAENSTYYHNYNFEDYEDHKYMVRWIYASNQVMDEPVTISIR